MHIAIDARIINSSTGRYIERLLTHLEQLNSPHQFTVLVRKKDKDYWTPTKPNFTVKVADYANYSFAEQIGFYFYLKRLKPDLVHFCMPQQPLLYRGDVVTTIHDLNLIRITENEGMSKPVLKFKQAIFRRLLHSVIERSARIIVPTDYTKQDVLDFHPTEKNRIVRTYEAAESLSAKTEPVDEYRGKKFIITVGRPEPYKNQRGVIRAHQLLIKKHPDLHLVIIGKRDSVSYKLEKECMDRGYEQIDFFGFASDEQLVWFYKHCAAYVFPSFMEGFGLHGLEAMLYGAPVASSNATCLPEVLGDAALYFDPADSQEMAQKIHTILNNPKLRKELVARGHEQVKKYSWERMARQTLAVYNEVL